jgi:micrococcal nuclease
MYEYRAIVRSEYDADTLRADIDLGFGIDVRNVALRLYGIDAPELGSPLGKPARDYLRNLLPVGTEIVIQTIKDEDDKYGRLLAIVWVGNRVESINDQLVDAGMARPYTGEGPKPW